MRRYETIFILRPNVGEEEINNIIGYTTDIIVDEKGATIELNRWGMKKLAYLIKKESIGYYVYCDYAATPAAVSEIERKFRIDDAILKYMTIKTAASITDEQIQQAIAEISEKAASEEAAIEETAADETEKAPAAAAEETKVTVTAETPAATPDTPAAPASESE